MKETRTARPEGNPSPISGHGLFAARPPTAGPRFRSIALLGSLVVELRARGYFKEASDGPCVALLSMRTSWWADRPSRSHGARGEDAGGRIREARGQKASGNNANVVCPCCKKVLPGNKMNPRVPTQLARQRGGADVVFGADGRRAGGARLLAVATQGQGNQGRSFRSPDDTDYLSVRNAAAALEQALSKPLGCSRRCRMSPRRLAAVRGLAALSACNVTGCFNGETYFLSPEARDAHTCDAIEKVSSDDPQCARSGVGSWSFRQLSAMLTVLVAQSGKQVDRDVYGAR